MTQLGLPEILIGLFPGGGGSQRLPRTMGVQASLMYMLQGKLFRPAEAAMMKVVDEVVPQGMAVDKAKDWAKANPNARSEEHTSELQPLMRISDAGLCLNKKRSQPVHST